MKDQQSSESIPRQNLHAELITRIRDVIVTELTPGDKVPERDLCVRFGVSRTPLREVLKVLAAEGLVKLLPNRGAMVSVLTAEEMKEIFLIIGALEALAGELACDGGTAEQIADVRKHHDEMVVAWKRRDLKEYFRLNQLIHDLIMEASGNSNLISVHKTFSDRIKSVRYAANLLPARWDQAILEHTAIIEALESRDGPRISKLLKDHLANKLRAAETWAVNDNTSERQPAMSRPKKNVVS